MKKVFCLLLCMLLVVCSLAACGGEEEPPHEHTYDTAWSSNATTHWYAPTCEHTDALASVALHVDSTNDGICDVCGYGSDHTHTYAAEWTMTETEHYKKVTCGHNVTPSSKGAHVDEDNNKLCDTCGYDYNHTHTYATEWTTTDAEYHWHDATCGCTIAPADKALHGDLDEDGYCDVCEVAMYEAGHTHKEADNAEWQKDAENHWKVCADHEGYVLLKAAHVDVKNNATNAEGTDGVCDVCGWFDVNHEHSYAEGDAWSKNDLGHWYAAACGHTGVISGFAEHTPGDDGACTVCGYTEHEHVVDYTLGLQSNADGHWLAGKCDVADEANACDEDIKFVVDAHFDLDKDGYCDACYRVLCEHEFEDEWTVEAVMDEEVILGYVHYHKATCECDVNNEWCADLNGWHWHTDDSNGNGVCDICYNTIPDHEHACEWPEYVYDATNNHWTYCDDCFSVVVNLGEHDDKINNETFEVGADGYCDLCGYTDNYMKVFEKIPSTNEFVYEGTVEYAALTYGFSYDIWDYTWNAETSTTIFEYGDDLYHQVELGGTEYWYTLDSNGNLFAVYGNYENGIADIGKVTMPDENALAGMAFNLYALCGVQETAYGVEALICALFDAGTTVGQDFAMNVIDNGDTGAVTFAFNNAVSFWGMGSYYQVVVSLVLGESAVTQVEIAVVTYGEDDFTVDEETGYATLNDGAEVTGIYSYVINQKAGERLAATEHTADRYLVSDYTLSREGTTINSGDTINLTLSTETYKMGINSASIGTDGLEFETLTYSYWGEITPAGTDPDADPAVCGWISSENHNSNPFNIEINKYTGSIDIACNGVDYAAPGTYKIKLDFAGGWTTELTIEAVRPAVSEVVLNQWIDGWENSDVTELSLYTTQTAGFTVSFNDYAEGEATVTVLKNCEGGDPVDVTSSVVTKGSNYDGSITIYQVTPTEAGAYTVVVTYGEGDDALTDSITLNVAEMPDVSELLNGTWQFYYEDFWGGLVDARITFANDGSCVVTIEEVSVNFMTNQTETTTVSFTGTYTYIEGVLTVKDTDGVEFMDCYNEDGCTHTWCGPMFSFDMSEMVVCFGTEAMEKLDAE